MQARSEEVCSKLHTCIFLCEAARKYTYILDKPYRWDSWAAPKDKDGKLDHKKT
jgi:hypothetical protein